MKKNLPVQLLLNLFLLFSTIVTRAQTPTLTIHTGLPRETSEHIVYGNGIYLTCFLSPVRFFASPDGTSWSPVTGPDFGQSAGVQPALAYGAGLFVCVGDSGKIFTSPDGSAWTRRNSGANAKLVDVQFLQGGFYLIGDSATFLHSVNGIDWTPLSIGKGSSSDSYNGLAYGNGYMVVTASNPNVTGKVLYRSDSGSLHSWTADTISIVYNLKFLKDHFYLFGDAIQFSKDAANWSYFTHIMVPDNQPRTGFYDGSRIYLIAINYANSSSYSSVYASIDDSTVAFNPIAFTTARITDGLYLNHSYFLYGYDGIEIASDSVNYHWLGAQYNALASDGHEYLGVGSANGLGNVFTSPDFNSWTERAPQNGIGLFSAVYDGSRYVIAGNDDPSGTGNSFIFTTPDGILLTDIGPALSRYQTISPIQKVAYGAGTYVGSSAVGLSYSGDAINWSQVQSAADGLPAKIKFLNGYFLGISSTGDGLLNALQVSTNGSIWTDITPHLPFTVESISDIVYDSSRYTIIGMEGGADSGNTTGFFSVSTTDINNPNSYGAKGTVTTPPAGTALSASYAFTFAYSHGHFTGGAYDMNAPNSGNSYLLYSSDGQHWDASPLGFTGALIGNVAKGDTFRLLSSSNVAITASFSNILPTDSLIDFDARAIARVALLNWRITPEENISRFIVRHSADGIHWDSIGSVAVTSRKHFERNYHFIDDDPMTGYNYYQLLLIGADGSQRVSPVRRLFFGRREVRVYPNPAFGSCTVEMPEAGAGVATLYSAAGLRVLRQEFNGYTVTLSLRGLPRGIYHLSVTQNGKQYNKEILHL